MNINLNTYHHDPAIVLAVVTERATGDEFVVYREGGCSCLDSKAWGRECEHLKAVVHYTRPSWVKCDCMLAELGDLPAQDHDLDCEFYQREVLR